MALQLFFDVSTGHIPSPDAISEVEEYVLAKGDEDVFLYVPLLDEVVIPEWFKELCLVALLWDCNYIRISAMGEIYDGLEQFNWE